jgi:glycosyltransferase involved in cell wall biosynthesis
MRIMIHSVPPWAPSGYGVQCALLARGLRDAGHEVTISAYGGFLREEPWEGIPLLSCGGTTKGVGRIAHNYRRARADVMIPLMDFWCLDARELDGLVVMPWVPVDVTPLGMLDHLQLEHARKACATLRPVAMSAHGQAMLADAGFEAALIPHMISPEYAPGDRAAWRRENGIPADVFLISSVGVNGDTYDRKAFTLALAAFQVFAEKHRNARLYLHTTYRSGTEGVDLLEVAKTLGLRDQVGFPDQLMRMADLHGPEYMAGMMRASDVMSQATRGEGFGVPIVEAMACGTPVIGSRCTSMPELIPREAGWLCDVQPEWYVLHNRWRATPLVADLVRCYEKAYGGARLMRSAAAAEGRKYRPEVVIPMWEKALADLPATGV